MCCAVWVMVCAEVLVLRLVLVVWAAPVVVLVLLQQRVLVLVLVVLVAVRRREQVVVLVRRQARQEGARPVALNLCSRGVNVMSVATAKPWEPYRRVWNVV